MSLFRLKTAGRWRMWTQNCYLGVNFLSDIKLAESQCLHFMFYVSLHFFCSIWCCDTGFSLKAVAFTFDY